MADAQLARSIAAVNFMICPICDSLLLKPLAVTRAAGQLQSANGIVASAGGMEREHDFDLHFRVAMPTCRKPARKNRRAGESGMLEQCVPPLD